MGLTHIFCGQIKANGSAAEGFHARPGGIDPTDGNRKVAIADDLKFNGGEEGIEGFAKIRVWNSNTSEYVERKMPNDSLYYFFPTVWDIPETTKKIQDLYEFCRGLKNQYGDYCITRYENNHSFFDVIIYVDQKDPDKSTIVSSFPAKENYCTKKKKIRLICDYSKHRPLHEEH